MPGAGDTAIITNAGTYTVTVNSSSAADALLLGEGDTNSSPTLLISSALDIGTLGTVASNAAVQISSVQNAGTLTVRSNLNFHRSSIVQTPGGHLITEAGCTTSLGELTSGAVRALGGGQWDNHGLVDIPFSSSLRLNGGVGWINHSNGVMNAQGGGLLGGSDGTGWFVNHGTFQRSGQNSSPTWACTTTNYGTVSANNTTLSFADYVQVSGSTDLGNSTINTARFSIQGGELRGQPTVGSGSSLYNDGAFHPGSEFGTFKLSGPFTNDSLGTYHMEIAGNSSYDAVDISDRRNWPAH